MLLKTLNLIAFITHYMLAIFFIIFFIDLNKRYPSRPLPGVEISMKDHTLDLNTDLSGNIIVQWNSVNTSVWPVTSIQSMLVSFFFITGTFHLFYYYKDDEYQRVINNKNNFYRWIEYSITSTLMLFIMALVTGTKDRGVYMMLFSSNIAMIVAGQQVEEAVRENRDWYVPMATSFLLLLTEFAVIGRNFLTKIDTIQTFLDQNKSNPKVTAFYVPGWLKPMLVVLFLFYISFGLVSLYGAYSNENYETIESIYIILSLVSKATLGAFVGYGLGLRQEGLLTPSENS